jgi:hypothetical protein
MATAAPPAKDAGKGGDRGNGPTYHVDIEGTVYDWDQPTITVADIRRLGNLPGDTPVMIVDEHNNQRTLQEGEVVELKPGIGFSKKVRYQRG